MKHLLMLAVTWTCYAKSGLDVVYNSSGPDQVSAQQQALVNCRVAHPFCFPIGCVQNGQPINSTRK